MVVDAIKGYIEILRKSNLAVLHDYEERPQVQSVVVDKLKTESKKAYMQG